MWLGHPDPATALLEQVRHDPDGDALCGLMTEWHAVFGSTPTTVRKAVEAAIDHQPNLLDAMREFPVEERRDKPFKAWLVAEEECQSDCRRV
jgi:hypothetical protein